MDNIEEKNEVKGTYVKELWTSFEKTGSVSAYLLYNVVREKSGKNRNAKEKNNTLQK